MRFEQLRLHPYGPFRDLTLDLASTHGRVVVVFGENEVGKSTLRRALQRFLFGFPHRHEDVVDDWRFKAGSLNLSATLSAEGEGSRKLWATRQKGHLNKSLRDASGSVLPEAALSPFLAGLTAEAFERRFALGHEQLRLGGAGLHESDGDAGAALLASTLGVSPEVITRLLSSLEAERDALFKPAGKRQKVNAALSKLEELNAQIKDRAGSAQAFATVQQELSLATVAAEQASVGLDVLEAEIRANDRRGAIGRILLDWPPVRDRLEATAGNRTLPGDYSLTARAAAQDQLVKTSALADELTNQRVELSAQREAIAFDRPLAQAVEDIAALTHRLEGYERDRVEVLRLREQRARAAERLEAAALALSLSAAEAETLTLPVRHRESLDALIRERGLLDDRFSKAQADVEGARADEADLERDRPEGADPASADLVDLQLSTLRAYRETLTQLNDAEAALVGRRARFDVECGRVLGRASPPEEVGRMTLVPEAVLVASINRFTEARQQCGTARAAAARAQERVVATETELSALQASEGAPSHAELDAARADRDARVEACERGPAEDRASRFAGLREAITEADVLADRMREQADAVARRAEREARLAAEKGEVAAAATSVASADEGFRAAERELDLTLGVEPYAQAAGPGGGIRWHHAVQRLIEDGAALAEEGAAHAARRARLESERSVLAALGPAATATVLGAKAAEASLADRGAALRKATEDVKAHGARAREIKKRLAATERDLSQVQERLERSAAAWAAQMLAVGLPSESTAQAAEAHAHQVTALQEARGAMEAAKVAELEHESRVATFEADVATVAAALREPPTADCGAFLRELGPRAGRHRADLEGHERLTASLDELSRKLKGARAGADAARERLRGFCGLAGVNDPAELPDFEVAAQARLEAERARDALSRRLRDADETGDDVDAAWVRIGSPEVELEAVRLQGQALEERRNALRAERDARRSAVGEQRERLRALELAVGCEGAAEEGALVLASARADAEQYLTITAAMELLRRHMAQLRRDREGPVLTRGGALFQRLTLGVYSGLQVREMDDGHGTICGVSSDGSLVPASRLSDGAQDQLYLALLLTALLGHLETVGPAPLILDDAFVHFDDTRAEAAFGVLAELAGKTQVLYFTHHEHLLKVLERGLPGRHHVLRLDREALKT